MYTPLSAYKYFVNSVYGFLTFMQSFYSQSIDGCLQSFSDEKNENVIIE